MTTVAILRREVRHNITFSAIPTIETCQALRAKGYDFNKASGQWYQKSDDFKTLHEADVIAGL